jgi:hypothetical protein
MTRATNLQVVAVLVEDPGGAEQHGGVRVVAAGVHLPGHLAPVLPLHFLLKQKHFQFENAGRFRALVLPLDLLICREDIRASVALLVFGE